MDAEKYLEELTRMCKHYKGNCVETGCPLTDPFEGNARYCPFMPNENDEYTPSIKIVEKWADANPTITNGNMIVQIIQNSDTKPMGLQVHPEFVSADEPFQVIFIKQSWWDEEYKEP